MTKKLEAQEDKLDGLKQEKNRLEQDLNSKNTTLEDQTSSQEQNEQWNQLTEIKEQLIPQTEENITDLKTKIRIVEPDHKANQSLKEEKRNQQLVKQQKQTQEADQIAKAQKTFPSNISPEQAWQRLTQKHSTGSKSSSRKFADVLIKEGIINSEREITDYIRTLQPGGKKIEDIRQQFKSYYRPKLLKLIDSQPKPLKYQKMRDIAESLDVREQGEISEQWYQKEFAKERKASSSTQITLKTSTAKDKYGVELKSQNNRRFDEVYGDENSATIREHKHIKGNVDIDQYGDNIQIVQHNRDIDTKIAQGTPLTKRKKDTPLILEKDGKKYRPKKLIYTFATPEGVRKNADWMGTELIKPENKNILSFEIINNKGEKKIIKTINDFKKIDLNKWLDLK